jgi:hypothetical protein
MRDRESVERSLAGNSIDAEQAMTRFTWWLVGAGFALFALFALVAATT